MKQNLFKTLSLSAAVLVASAASAQENMPAGNMFRTWSIGVNAGVMAPVSPLGGQNDYSNWKTTFGYGLYIKKQVNPYFSVRLDGVMGKLEGDNSTAYGSGYVNSSPFASFKTDVDYATSLNAVFNMFNIDMFKKENAMQMYASFGAGVTGYSVTTTSAGVAVAGTTKTEKLVIPAGIGAKFRVSDQVNIDLGLTMNFVDADNLDGYNRGANDKFTYGYAGLEFALGKGKQLAFHNPVAMTYDEAVRAKAEAASANAMAVGLRKDLDQQKADNAKLRSDISGLMNDSDGDGVADKFDKCPNTPKGTVVDGSGCPLVVAAPKVTERIIVTEADRKVVADAIKNLEFDLGKSTIRSKSYSTLNRVAALLIEKNFSLKLAGHTDNTGSDALNERLSKDRAESVKAYLVSQGANASRIEATGYGESQPIASNKTASGRQANRRVEFTLY